MSKIIIYKAKDGYIEQNINLLEETTQLSQQQMHYLYQKSNARKNHE